MIIFSYRQYKSTNLNWTKNPDYDGTALCMERVLLEGKMSDNEELQ